MIAILFLAILGLCALLPTPAAQYEVRDDYFPFSNS